MGVPPKSSILIGFSTINHFGVPLPPFMETLIKSRRKFRTETSDNMARWKSRGGKSQRREEKKREDQSRERVRRKKMQVREKVEKSRFILSF